jgi:hypothetical protein
MFFDLLRHIIRTFGTRFLQLDVAIPEPPETEPPVAVPGIPVAVSALRILLPVLAAALIIVLLCFLFRRHRKNEPEAEKKEEE